MAQLGNGQGYAVNPNETEEDFGIVPAGEYLAIIESSDYVPAKSGKGMMLKLTYKIIDGQFAGRKVFENLNLQHENAQAETIARKSLNSICLALGMSVVQDSAQLHNQPMKLDIGIKPASGDYEASNRIKKHLPASGSITPPPAGNNHVGATTAGAGVVADINPATGKPWQPWEKRP